MGLTDTLLSAMNLNKYEDDGFDEDYYDEEEEVTPAKSLKPSKKAARVEEDFDDDDFDERPSKKQNQKVTNIRAVKRTSNYEVCVIRPTNVEEAREITDVLLSNKAVVLNLEGVDIAIAQRIIDFASGSTYAINGNLQKISNSIFIITPASVEVSGDFQEIVSGAFNVPPISRM